MRLFLNTIKLFIKSPSVIAPFVIMLAVVNVGLVPLFRTFLRSQVSDEYGINDSIYYFSDIRMIVCFFLVIFFVFISYEFMRKEKECSLDEAIYIRGMRGGLICLNQLLVLFIAAVAVALNVAIYFFLGYLTLSGTEVYKSEIIQIVLIDILLLSLASIGVGFLISKLTKRFVGYVVIVLLVFLLMPNLERVFSDWQIYYHIPVFYIRDFLSFIPPDLSAVNDPLYGFPYEWYRTAAMLFWCVTAILICGWKLINKKKIRIVFGVCGVLILCALAYGVENKGSVLLMGDQPGAAIQETYYYYGKMSAKEKIPEFKVKEYDMEFSMDKILRARVRCDISSDEILPEYEFTLYHGYEVNKIEDENGNSISFLQKGDYLTIDNQSMDSIKSLVFFYDGYSPLFYSNKKACFLPGFFPYYPKAGCRKIYDDYFIEQEDSTAYYHIRMKDNAIWSNLERVNGELQGEADNVILIKGHMAESDADEKSGVYFPAQRTSLDNIMYFRSEELHKKENELKDFLDIKDDFINDEKMVINIPWSMAFQSLMKSYYESGNYVLVQGQPEPYEVLRANTKAVGKEVLKDVFFELKLDADTNVDELTMFRDEELIGELDDYMELYDEVVLKLRGFGVRRVARELYRYLISDTIDTDSLTFVKSIGEKP